MQYSSYFRNKTIWITGASSGIGEQIALLLSQCDARLIISSRRSDELERVKLLCKSPELVDIVTIDLSDELSVRKAWDTVKSKYHHIDMFFNNGGISQRSFALDTPLEVDRQIFEVNYFSNILLAKLVGASMTNQKSGHIIVTSTLLGKWGFHTRSGYAASKHALHGFYDSLRMEIEDLGVQVTLILPGFINTSISQNALNSAGERTQSQDANQANGMSAEECAGRILQGVAEGRKEFGIGGKEMNGLWVKRFFPRLFDRILKKKSPN